jgi:hypothetical protein
MFNKVLTSRLYYRICCLLLFAITSAASFHGFYDRTHFNEAGLPGAWHEATFEGMVDGTAYRPYVYRQLLPDLANWFDRITPESIKTRLYNRQMNLSTTYVSALTSSSAAWKKPYFFRYFVIYFLTYLSAFFATCAMYLVCRAIDLPPPASALAPVVVIFFIPYIQNGGGYFYDYPELAFLALAVWFALKLDWWWMIPIVILGTWNKESFLIFILTLYPIFRLRSSRLVALLGVGVLGSISAAVYYALRLRFAHNPGSTVFVWWRDELQLLLHPRALLLATRETYGIPMIMGYTIGPIILMSWTVWRAWPFLPRAIQRHAQIAALINIPLYLLFVQPGKLRDLSMLNIAFLLVLAVNFNQWMIESREPQLLPASDRKQGQPQLSQEVKSPPLPYVENKHRRHG